MASIARIGGICAMVLAPALSACASQAGFPSLARRSAERYGAEAPPAAPATLPAAPQTSTDTTVKLAQFRQTADAAHTRFIARRAAAERAAAGAGPLGSESWAGASVALAALEEAHDEQSAALAEIDQLQVDRQVADAGVDDADIATIMTARDAVAAAATADGEVVSRLRVRLGK